MLDNQLIKGISDHWDHCLKKIIIDVKSSYRNLRFQFFSRRAGKIFNLSEHDTVHLRVVQTQVILFFN